MNKLINQLSDKSTLIIGAGHIGEACAHSLIRYGIKKVILQGAQKTPTARSWEVYHKDVCVCIV